MARRDQSEDWILKDRGRRGAAALLGLFGIPRYSELICYFDVSTQVLVRRWKLRSPLPTTPSR